MMSLISRVLCTLLLFPFSSLCITNQASFPYAVTLTPSSILVSTVTRTGDFELSRFAAEGKYKSYLDNILHYHGRKSQSRGVDTKADNATIAIIQDAFNAVRRNLTLTLGYKPKFAALYGSSFFNISSLEAARHALYPKDAFTKGGPKKIGDVYSGACFAHGLDKCESLRTPAECEHEEWLINLVLVVEYEKQYLSISVVEADRVGFGEAHGRFAPEFGEETGRALMNEIGRDEYTSRLSQFFEDAISRVLNMRSMPYEREQIRAIVPAGEASSAAFAEILGIAHKAVNNGVVRVLNDIDPALVAARGAAMMAKNTVVRKDLWKHSGFEDEEPEHDEL